LKKIFVYPAMVLGMALAAHAQAAPTKVAVIQVQTAILSTKDGQKAAADLQSRFAPKKAEIDKDQADVAALQDQLKKGQATMSEDAKAKLMRDIDGANTRLQRKTQDAQSDLDEEQQKIMQELGNKMMAVIDKYAQANGIAVVIDVSNPQTPVLWAASGIDITNEIVKLYDQASPGTGASPATSAPKPGGTSTPATTPKPTGVTTPVPTLTPPAATTKKK
jgi:outer membrane protein